MEYYSAFKKERSSDSRCTMDEPERNQTQKDECCLRPCGRGIHHRLTHRYRKQMAVTRAGGGEGSHWSVGTEPQREEETVLETGGGTAARQCGCAERH